MLLSSLSLLDTLSISLSLYTSSVNSAGSHLISILREASWTQPRPTCMRHSEGGMDEGDVGMGEHQGPLPSRACPLGPGTLSQVWHCLNFRYLLTGYVDSSAHWEKLGITQMLYNVQILYGASGSKKLLLLFLESWKITLKHPSMFDIFLQSQGLI